MVLLCFCFHASALHLIKAADLDPAKQSLSLLTSRSNREKQEVMEILALAPDKPAFALLNFLLGNPLLDSKTRDRIFQLAADRAHLNFTFVQILLDHGNQAQLIHFAPLLKHILSRETHADLLKQIIRTAGKHCLETLINDVAEFIFYDNMTLKTAAVKALEQIGTVRALEQLEQVALTDKCDQNILDTLERMKTKLAGSPLTEVRPDTSEPQTFTNLFHTNLTLLASNSLGERYQAFTWFSNQGPWVARALKESLNTLDHDLLINLLQLTAITVPQQAVESLLALAADKKIENPVRFAVYNALEAFPELESAAGIIKEISDPSLYVRMAAIKVLERHCSDYIIAEIKNKIESGTKTGEILVHTILDARAIHLIEALMISDTFSYIASNYLDRGAPLPVIESYIHVLEKRNLKSTLKKYIRLKDTAVKKDEFVVISSSPSFLDVYAKLIDTCGYGTRTFTSTQKAFETIVVEKPVAIVCDLFLNQMTGMGLAREVREMYGSHEMPIVISSLQKNLNKAELDQELKKAQVNTFCDFPARSGQIKSWIH